MNSLALSHGLLNSTLHTRIQCNLTQRWCTLRQTVGSDAKRCTSAIAKLKTEKNKQKENKGQNPRTVVRKPTE